ncbi:serine protease [Okeania sp. SIO2B3]|uniref:S1 family peptidase n=1 Tax=Okeania sp. SIO2B3 TaxID=2607784 RepID=UPI0013C0B27A|nr:serine protease [Okeania sp. SIO2B3]NET41721.1 trypsin-like peptidase domain-containing protein [Okeania sp. SIO2B3]
MKQLISLMAIIPTFLELCLSQVASTPEGVNLPLIQAASVSTIKNNPTVEAISRPVTVRLLGENIAGSGVIISRKGTEYFVLTCAHVLDSNQENKLAVLTVDGKEYSAHKDTRFNFKDLDLAIVKFSTNNEYKVAVVNANFNLSLGEQVYVAGFPNYERKEVNLVTTVDLGIKPYNLTKGKVIHLLNLSLERGYKIGMSNEIEIGMSGGPVLNKNGELVGIIGRAKYAFGGFDAYRFSDGSQPSQELLDELLSASWAIPIAKLNQRDDFAEIVKTNINNFEVGKMGRLDRE